MPYNYSHTFGIKTLVPLLQDEIIRLTWSGCCFTSEKLEKYKNAKRKEVIYLSKEFEVKKSIIEKETNEFLKLIKHSEYCIMDQLKKTLPRSLLCLWYSALSRTKMLYKRWWTRLMYLRSLSKKPWNIWCG
jgi:hypothetical protein